jgi:hypothetical protein
MNRILFIFIFLRALLTFGQENCDPKDFEILKVASRKNFLTEIEFLNLLKIVRNLENKKCFDYIEKKNGEEYVETGLTYLFGQLCINANSDKSFQEYVDYLNRHIGSAEEQRSFSFEYIFKKNPQRVFKLIKYNLGLLDHLVWGFLNNRLHGERDPYENDPNKAYTKYDSEPPRVLTVKTYKDIFYKTYPSLKNETMYIKEIDYLLTNIKDELKDWQE